MSKRYISLVAAILLLAQLMTISAFAADTSSSSTSDGILSETFLSFDGSMLEETAVTVFLKRFSCELDYGISEEETAYTFPWLDYSVQGNQIILRPTRANYSAQARTAQIKVVRGSKTAILTVSQAPCSQNAPELQLKVGDVTIASGKHVGTVNTALDFQLLSKGVRKLCVRVLDLDKGSEAACCVKLIQNGEDCASAFSFPELAEGNYRVIIHSSNSDTDNDYWCQRQDLSFDLCLNRQHQHTWQAAGYEAAHPHTLLESCSCGYLRLAGADKYIFSCTQCNPAAALSSKNFESFEQAEQMIRYACQLDWSEVGVINYVSQNWSYEDKDSFFYHGKNGYWRDPWEATQRCTRAASAMAFSYMGITALPKNYTVPYCPYTYHAGVLGCETVGGDRESLGQDYSVSMECFEQWYERYHYDSVGKYSPIVLHTFYEGGYHSFAVFGRDAKDPAYYYVVDSGTSDYIRRVKLVEVDGLIRVAEFWGRDGVQDVRYSAKKSMMGVWQYINPGIA